MKTKQNKNKNYNNKNSANQEVVEPLTAALLWKQRQVSLVYKLNSTTARAAIQRNKTPNKENE